MALNGLFLCWCVVKKLLTHYTGKIKTSEPFSACTGSLMFSQLSAAVVRDKANDGVVYAIWLWFEDDTTQSGVV